MNNEEPLLLSVCIITYNQAQFLSTAIESVLNQHVSFPYEIIVGDDGSTDTTPEIGKRYQQQCSHLHYIHKENNQGISMNWKDTLLQAKGKYIALLEGDDYWIDDNKLQRQVSFMEQNEDYSICGHDYLIEYSSQQKLRARNTGVPERDFDAHVLLEIWPFQSSTVVFRKSMLYFPKHFTTTSVCDLSLFLALLSKGKCRYLNTISSVYRVHSDSFSRKISSPTHAYDWMMCIYYASLDFKIVKKSRRHQGFFKVFTYQYLQKLYQDQPLLKSLY